MSRQHVITGCPIQHPNKGKIFSRENLLRFVQVDENLMNNAMKAAQTRAREGKNGFYGFLPVAFPLHYRAFRNMHDVELQRGLDVNERYDMNEIGLINFILDLGPVPSGMQNPIVTRRNLDVGYHRNNIVWANAHKVRPRLALYASSYSYPNRMYTN